MTDTGKQDNRKPFTLYDAGGWFLVAVLTGGYFIGLVIDYFWNYLVFSFSLRRLRFNVTTSRKHVYCAVATVLGLFIDWLYYELAWGFLVVGNLRVPPVFERAGTRPILELSTIIIPIFMLAIVNYCLSRLLLRVTSRQAVILGAVMGFFTAPWLIVGFILLHL